jgi:hypothetical protein
VELDAQAAPESHHATTPAAHSWDTEDADHCETPAEAYADIAELLEWLARRLKRRRETLRIYDPYYCAGGTAAKLGALGFEHVYNRCEDFYARLETGNLPEYDVLVTNPPYSCVPRDHVAALMTFLGQSGRPWLVVQPRHVYTKPYYAPAVLGDAAGAACRPFYLVPPSPRAYEYKAPQGFRRSGASRTSPHVTFWYCWLGPNMQGEALQWLATQSDAVLCGRLRLAATEYHLPDAFKDSNDRTRKKVRKGQKKKKEAAAATEGGDEHKKARKGNGDGKGQAPSGKRAKRMKGRRSGEQA